MPTLTEQFTGPAWVGPSRADIEEAKGGSPEICQTMRRFWDAAHRANVALNFVRVKFHRERQRGEGREKGGRN